MEVRKLDKAVLKLWYIKALIASVAMIAAFVVALFLIEDSKVRLVVALSAGIPDLVAVGFILVLPYFRFKMFEYGYDEKRIFVKQGVIFRRKVLIPVCQIQDLHREQGPLMLMLGLGEVTISTAGSSPSAIVPMPNAAPITSARVRTSTRILENLVFFITVPFCFCFLFWILLVT